LKKIAEDYNFKAKQLKDILYWRNQKLKIILGVLGCAAALSTILPIIQKVSS
jgi:LysM repeat protein